VDEFKEMRNGCRIRKEEGKRVGLAFEFATENIIFILIVGALEKVMDNCLRDDPSAVWAYWHFGVADAEKMLVEWGMACSKLC